MHITNYERLYFLRTLLVISVTVFLAHQEHGYCRH